MIGYAFACLPPLLCFGLRCYLLRAIDAPPPDALLPLAARCGPARTFAARLLRQLNGVEVSLPPAAGPVVHCVWAPGGAADATAGGDRCCCANAMVLDDMADWAAYYLNLGAGVLLLTYWGARPGGLHRARRVHRQALAAGNRLPRRALGVPRRGGCSASCSSARRWSTRSCGVSMGGGAASALGVACRG